MTWGPASNTLYEPVGDFERFCIRVHVICQEAPDSYDHCRAEWSWHQWLCPVEARAQLSCYDALYDCGDYENWDWWDLVQTACAPQINQLDLCIESFVRW